jgi:hypothetical protein
MPLTVRAIQRGAVADRYQHVVQTVALAIVVPNVVGSDDPEAELAGQRYEVSIASCVAQRQRLLQLDEEVIRPEPAPIAARGGNGALPLTSGDQCGHLAMLIA